jgi:hypothetical protein
VFGCGHSGAGPHLLYQALVHAVDGSVALATDGRFIDEPSSFYGWLTRCTSPCTRTGQGETAHEAQPYPVATVRV